MRKILLLLAFSLSFMIANAQKVKIEENYEEDGVKYTKISPKLFAFSDSFWCLKGIAQTLFAFTDNDTTQYFVSINVIDISRKGATKESIIVKLKNDSIIELPMYDTEVVDLGTSITSTTRYNSWLKNYTTYTDVNDRKFKFIIYYISQENMNLMCNIGIEKQRFVAKDKIVDLPSVNDQITNYYREGVRMIKDAQSSYSRYDGL